MLAGRRATAPDTAEPGSIEEIAKATTEPAFLSPVGRLPPRLLLGALAARVPPPHSRGAGRAGRLRHGLRVRRALAAASPRVELFTIGRSEEGRDIVLLAIADEQGIQSLERLKRDTAALADPRTHGPPRPPSRSSTRARPIYYFNAALHSDETGSTESVLELAYRLAVSEQPMIQRIRENLVVLINPVSNPDGRDKMVEWFYRFLKGKTDRNTLPRQSPPYWSKYAFVDINRDAHQLVHESHAGGASHVLRLAPHGRARSARERRAADVVERHRAVQPEHRSDHVQRIPGAELPRSADADRHSACPASRPGISARRSRTCTSIRWR